MSNLQPVFAGAGGVPTLIIKNMQVRYPVGRVWGLDLGEIIIDTSTGGTARVTTLSAWMSTSNDSLNAPQSAWTNSFQTTVSWTSQFSTLVPGTYNEPARLAAIAAGLQNLLVSVRVAVTAAGLIPV